MSKDSLNTSKPDNDEIINDMTKEFESNHLVEEPVLPPDNYFPEKFEEDSDSESPKVPEVQDDYVDEDGLKEAEVDLTEEEKVIRQDKALSLKEQGNNEFKSGKYLDSVTTYTEALNLCPLTFQNDRSILYSNRAASKIKLDRNKSAIDDCTKALELNPTYLRAYIRRAKLYESEEKLDECLADWNKILELDPDNCEARAAIIKLPPLINERNEKLKTEMFGKLKDLGNMFLKPFGLSTENFQMQQDPSTGGYSVNFQK